MELAGDERHEERLGGDPTRECVGAVEGEEVAALGDGVEAVGEAGLDAGALVEEGKRPDRRGDTGGEPGAVLLALKLHSREGGPRPLCLDDADGLPFRVEQVIGEPVPRLERKLADGDAGPRREIQRGEVLHLPAGLGQGAVDGEAGEGFGGGQAGQLGNG
ncbi:MAG: hypothetical protein WKG32_13875 [Gemmatimonadaceae bacterium]